MTNPLAIRRGPARTICLRVVARGVPTRMDRPDTAPSHAATVAVDDVDEGTIRSVSFDHPVSALDLGSILQDVDREVRAALAARRHKKDEKGGR